MHLLKKIALCQISISSAMFCEDTSESKGEKNKNWGQCISQGVKRGEVFFFAKHMGL